MAMEEQIQESRFVAERVSRTVRQLDGVGVGSGEGTWSVVTVRVVSRDVVWLLTVWVVSRDAVWLLTVWAVSRDVVWLLTVWGGVERRGLVVDGMGWCRETCSGW